MTGECSYVPSADTKCHHFLCYGGKKFLIDPVLTPKGSWPLCSLNRYLLMFFPVKDF